MSFAKLPVKRMILILCLLAIPGIVSNLLPFPELDSFQEDPYALPILDRNGKELFVQSLDNGLIRLKVDTGKLPPDLVRTVLRSEDKWFYFHPGVNPFSAVRAALANRKAGRIVAGASTITMQLARMVRPREKGIHAKLMEMVDAFRIEMKLSKKEILALYLSHIPFGQNLEGYAAASKQLYQKDLTELTKEEMAILSILPRSPLAYNPVDRRDNCKDAVLRTHRTMDTGLLKDAFDEIAKNENLPKHPIEAPHFVEFTVQRLTKEDYQKGDPIETTLDLETQRWVESLLAYYLDSVKYNRISNGAVLLLHRGEITAYIGSGDFFDKERQGQIDGVQILRQPGSTLKPYLYELALEMGFTAASVLPDIPTSFGREETYRPENFSLTYHGPVRIRTALGSSLNIPAVYMLERLGVDNFIAKLKQLGFSSLNGQEANLGLGLAVGNAEVSLYELVRAFRIFKESGEFHETKWLLHDKARKGEKVMDPSAAEIIRDILSDPSSRVLGFGRRSVLNTDYPSYFKTGTSNQFNNIWALGATTDYTCGIWMGNFSGETVIGRTGSSLPAQMVDQILQEYSRKEDFPPLTGVQSSEVCSLSGGLKTPNCLTTTTEYFTDTRDLKPCPFHKAGGRVELPPEYSEWKSLYHYDQYAFSPTSDVEVLSPREGAVYFFTPELPKASQGVEIRIAGTGSFSIRKNGAPWFSGSLPYEQIHYLDKGNWDISIAAGDRVIHRNIRVE